MSLIFLIFLAFNVQSFSLRDDYPRQYTVQSGDTLWGIANRYLKDPWEWKTLWKANPQVKNPKRLYAGAVLELRYHKQNPYLHVHSNGTVRLSPHLHSSHLENAILPISLMDIKPFLNRSIILDQNFLITAPYIVGYMGEHLITSQGEEVYVKDLHPSTTLPAGANLSYAIYREGPPYLEPGTKRFLGFNATLVGYGELMRGGNPATVLITEITEGIKIKDRVLPNTFPQFNLYFLPKAPRGPIEGRIIDLPPVYTQGAVGLVAVLDRGQDSGLEAGDVLGLYSPNRIVQDPLLRGKTVKLPRERIGEVMVFRTFSKTSFALVVRSTRTIHLMDIVTNP